MSGAEWSRRAVIAGAAGLAALPARALTPPVVDAPAGRFVGTAESGVLAFRGIRYGRAERFRAPVAVAMPGEIRPAQTFGPVCPQATRLGPQDEDCLFLNVWTAAADRRAGKPVLVYIHGGAYATGSVTDPMNDGHALAARGDVVVVTVNHRLNAFGYLYLARLDPRFADSGNAGQLDLMIALRWVRDNIAAFGGDPGQVTVFGQSGGGAKIATMTAMPAAAGLFHRAITMSGQQVTASGPLHAHDRARAFLAKAGVAERDLAPLLVMPAARLVEALSATDPIMGGNVSFAPVLDMRHLSRHPFWPDASPQGLSVPMLLGNVRDETRGFISPDGALVRGLDWANLPDRMARELRVDILPEWVVAEYRRREPGWSPADVLWAATTAGRSWRGQVEEAEARARAGTPAWVYQLDFGSPIDPVRGAFHTHDIPLVFGTLDAPGAKTGTGPAARKVSRTMQDAFVRFATTGSAPWPAYTLPRRATMIFDVDSHVADDPRRWQRELFARVPYIQPGS
ncbi:MAG: carboxylesterase family protein [Sphingomonas phyllosphaerae]|uniref:carboxylesterase/lipase family protein n=1 Tax=Sphingomonas phyllosphaerae TaxID=257003 RepID=UPI002FF792E5